LRRRGPGSLKGQIKVFDDLVYDFMVFNKGNNAHGSPAFGTDKGVDLIDLLYHLSPDFGMNIESCMTPLQYLLDKVFIDQLFFKEKREDLKCEKSTEQGIIELKDLMELSFFICPSLCDQKVKMWMEVDPASE